MYLCDHLPRTTTMSTTKTIIMMMFIIILDVILIIDIPTPRCCCCCCCCLRGRNAQREDRKKIRGRLKRSNNDPSFFLIRDIDETTTQVIECICMSRFVLVHSSALLAVAAAWLAKWSSLLFGLFCSVSCCLDLLRGDHSLDCKVHQLQLSS